MLFDFTFYLVATLVGNWIWDFWTKRSVSLEQKAKMLKNFVEKIEHCCHELDYNSTPGIGGSRCPFTTEAQRRLLYSEEVILLGDDLTQSLKRLIIDAGRANGESPSVPPSSVKSGSKLLKDMLMKRSEELKTPEKPKELLKKLELGRFF